MKAKCAICGEILDDATASPDLVARLDRLKRAARMTGGSAHDYTLIGMVVQAHIVAHARARRASV